MKFIYYLAAIGDSGLDKKLAILSKNLNHIYKNINCKFDIVINCYNSCDIIKSFIAQFDFIGIKYIYNKTGVLTELFLTNPHNASLSNYDYILFMLDDVEIQDMNLHNMINIKEKCGIEILSPKVIASSHPFMNAYDSNTLTINNALEVYCLLMKYKDFIRFISIHTIENKWMWGADFLFGFFNIKSGVYNRASVKHMLLPSKKYIDNASKLMTAYLKKVNFNGSIKDIIPVKKVINLRTGASKITTNDNGVGKVMNLNNNKATTVNVVDRSKTISTLSKVNTTSTLSNINKKSTISNLTKVNAVNKSSTMSNLTKVNKSSTMSNINKVNTVNKSSNISNLTKVNKPSTMNTLTNVNNANKSSTLTNKKSKFTLSNLINK